MPTYNSPDVSNSVIRPFGGWSLNPSWPPPIFQKIKQTKNGDLVTCPEFGKSRRTECLSTCFGRHSNKDITKVSIPVTKPGQHFEKNEFKMVLRRGLIRCCWLLCNRQHRSFASASASTMASQFDSSQFLKDQKKLLQHLKWINCF